VYILDRNNDRVCEVTPNGNISTFAGTGKSGFSEDRGLATSALLLLSLSVAVDGPGKVYISDQGKGPIRKVNTSGILATVAGEAPIGDAPATTFGRCVVLDAASETYASHK